LPGRRDSGVTRQSILRKGWIAGSSPAMTTNSLLNYFPAERANGFAAPFSVRGAAYAEGCGFFEAASEATDRAYGL
jgi:hypothetical protein